MTCLSRSMPDAVKVYQSDSAGVFVALLVFSHGFAMVEKSSSHTTIDRYDPPLLHTHYHKRACARARARAEPSIIIVLTMPHGPGTLCGTHFATRKRPSSSSVAALMQLLSLELEEKLKCGSVEGEGRREGNLQEKLLLSLLDKLAFARSDLQCRIGYNTSVLPCVSPPLRLPSSLNVSICSLFLSLLFLSRASFVLLVSIHVKIGEIQASIWCLHLQK